MGPRRALGLVGGQTYSRPGRRPGCTHGLGAHGCKEDEGSGASAGRAAGWATYGEARGGTLMRA